MSPSGALEGVPGDDGHDPYVVPAYAPWRPSGAALVALVVGLLVTAAVGVTTIELYRHNERRLLNERVREVGLLFQAAVTNVQTPLASGAAFAGATGGEAARFRTFMAPYVGASGQFRSVSLWPSGAASSRPRAVVGEAPAPEAAAQVARLAAHPGKLEIVNLLASPKPALGFVYTGTGPGRDFTLLAQSPLPANRRSPLDKNSAFSDIGYVIYLGRARSPRDLLLTSERHLPVSGLQASEPVPFGAGSFTLVVVPHGSLAGGFFQDVPWLAIALGVIITLAAALVTDRLARRRRAAERLAAELDLLASENRKRYIEQRGIAHTLQQALLPASLPNLPGVRVSAQYVPAQAGGDVGGDWYDVVALDDGRALLVIGDVSGHGIQAATTMALVRHAMLAYIAEDHRPASVLRRLSDFVTSGSSERFATVLCALVDVDGHRVTVASAGHLPPLLLHGSSGEFVDLHAGPPIGFPHGSAFVESTVAVPPGATLVAYTDGLVERRGEVLDEGLERLREMASTEQFDDDLLARLARDLTSDDHRDDTALVSIKWQS